MLPLQAADIFAYCMHDASHLLKAYPTKSVMSKLADRVPHYGWIEDERRIRQFVEFAEEDKRIGTEQDHRRHMWKRQLEEYGFAVEKRHRGLTIRGSRSRMDAFALMTGMKLVEDK